MVFVWSQLVHGHGAYTLIQVAVNDLLIFVLYVPTVRTHMPWRSLPFCCFIDFDILIDLFATRRI
jgi:ACR3 family arsenite transporter